MASVRAKSVPGVRGRGTITQIAESVREPHVLTSVPFTTLYGCRGAPARAIVAPQCPGSRAEGHSPETNQPGPRQLHARSD